MSDSVINILATVYVLICAGVILYMWRAPDSEAKRGLIDGFTLAFLFRYIKRKLGR